METTSYKVGVNVGEPKPVFNGMRFGTELEANYYGNDLQGRWTQVREFASSNSACRV